MAAVAGIAHFQCISVVLFLRQKETEIRQSSVAVLQLPNSSISNNGVHLKLFYKSHMVILSMPQLKYLRKKTHDTWALESPSAPVKDHHHSLDGSASSRNVSGLLAK